MVVEFSLSKAGLEVYNTNTPTKKVNLADSNNSNSKFTLQNGDNTYVTYIGELYSDSYESDYSDISSNASIVLPMDYYNLFFKGKKVALKKGLQTTTLNWEDMDTPVLGFVTELSYNKDKINVKIQGMDALLNQEAKFTFKKTKISKIVKEIIKASGLKAKVDVTGLKDHVINFTNVSSSKNDSSDSSSDLNLSNTELDKVVQDIIGSETDDYEKLKKIHNWARKNVTYDGYECSKYGCDPVKAYKNRKHLNCGDTAVLLNALYKIAGLDSYIIHGDYHFWNIVTIKGKKYASDGTGDRPLGEVWSGSGHHNTPFGGSKANEKAICG